MPYRLPDPTQASTLAEQILRDFPSTRVFALPGDLGAGKTTLIKGFCQAWGVKDATSSPSFALVSKYWSVERSSDQFAFTQWRAPQPILRGSRP